MLNTDTYQTLDRYLEIFSTVCPAVLNNKNVLALMFLMVKFAQDETEYDPEVGRMLFHYWTMLIRHLANTSCQDIEEKLAWFHYQLCFRTIQRVFKNVFTDELENKMI